MHKHILKFPTPQKGLVVIMLLLLLTLGTSGYLLSEVTFSNLAAEREAKTNKALAAAKKILMSRMLAKLNGGTPEEIGTLVCPDLDDDGVVDFSVCTGRQDGRIPFLSLGVPEIRDGYNERLWYAFPELLDVNGSGTRVNTNNLFNDANLLTLDGEPVMAVIISAGERLDVPDQSGRPSNLITDYLEDENANGDTVYTSGVGLANFNDRVIAITREEMLTHIHNRVIANVKDYLEDFNATLGYYPYPEDADFDCRKDTPGNLSGDNIGRIPLTFNYTVGVECIYPEGAGPLIGTDDLSPILTKNLTDTAAWQNDIWYAVSDDCTLAATGANCDGLPATDYLTLDGNRVKYIIFLAGQTPAPTLAGNVCKGVANDVSQAVPAVDFCDSLEDFDPDPNQQNTDGDNRFFSNITPGLNSARNDIIYGEPSL